MARNYRKVDRAVEELRRMAGAYAAADPARTESAWFVLGYSKGILEDVLDLLQAGQVVAASESFVQGYDDISDLMVPLPFPEVGDAR